MTRTVPIGLVRQRHGHKRKGKPVEAWKMDVEQDENAEEVRIRGVHLNAIEQIANGVEQMMFSWNLDTFERGQEHAKLFNPPALPPGDDEVQSSNPKADSQTPRNLAEPGVHKLHSNSSPRHGFSGVPKQSAYPLQPLQQTPGDDSILEIRAPLEAAGDSGATIRQDRMSGGAVSKGGGDPVSSFRRPTCEKNVGTDASSFQELQTPRGTSNKVGRTDCSPQLSFRGDREALLSSPPARESSCPYQFSRFSATERQLQASPRKENPVACHAATLTHSMSNFPHSRPEDETRLDKSTFVDVDSAALTASPTPRGCSNIRPNSGTLSHSSSYYWRRPTGAIETLEVGGHPVVMPALWNGADALKNKFESLINMTSGALFTQSPRHIGAERLKAGGWLHPGKESPCSAPPEISSMEDLQLALIECATEYEIKTLDARMKMQEMRVQKRQITSCEFDQPANALESQNHVNKMMSVCGGAKILQSRCALQHVQREGVLRSENMKENMQKPDPQPWKKKERWSPDLKKAESGIRGFSRLFDKQRRSLDDALNHVDRLKNREVAKKDRELVEWQLKEKETKTQLHQLEDKVKKSRVFQASSRLEPRKLLLALPALRESLRSLKAEEQRKMRSPLAETSQELISNSENKSMSEMSDRDCSLDTRLQSLEERTFEMDELKVTMSKLAGNMAELSMAFKDHVQFVNNRLGAIHGFVTKRNIPASADTTVGQLKLAALETLEAEREIIRSSTP